MRALDKFILRMQTQQKTAPGSSAKGTTAGQPSAVRERPSDINSNGRQ